MNREDGIAIASALEDALNIPSMVCELIEREIEQGKYEEVLQFVANRWREIQRKKLEKQLFDKVAPIDFEQFGAEEKVADVRAWCREGKKYGE